MIKKFARLMWAIITLPYGVLKTNGVLQNALKGRRIKGGGINMPRKNIKCRD